MSRLRVCLGVGVALAAGAPSAALAQPPYGPDCRAPAAGVAWVGTIRGTRIDLFDRRETRYQEHCFTSLAACERWLYAARTYYTYEFSMDGCRPIRQSRPIR